MTIRCAGNNGDGKTDGKRERGFDRILLHAVQQISHRHHVERVTQPVRCERLLEPTVARVAFCLEQPRKFLHRFFARKRQILFTRATRPLPTQRRRAHRV